MIFHNDYYHTSRKRSKPLKSFRNFVRQKTFRGGAFRLSPFPAVLANAPGDGLQQHAAHPFKLPVMKAVQRGIHPLLATNGPELQLMPGLPGQFLRKDAVHTPVAVPKWMDVVQVAQMLGAPGKVMGRQSLQITFCVQDGELARDVVFNVCRRVKPCGFPYLASAVLPGP